ncbi:MAG: helix-turn-helix domain-containing protein [Clostridia bacterium]
MAIFHEVYSHEELESRCKIVLINLKDRANKDGECWPAIKTIAKDTSLSVSTIKRALNDLIKQGYIVKEKRFRPNGSNSSNLYIIKR